MFEVVSQREGVGEEEGQVHGHGEAGQDDDPDRGFGHGQAISPRRAEQAQAAAVSQIATALSQVSQGKGEDMFSIHKKGWGSLPVWGRGWGRPEGR